MPLPTRVAALIQRRTFVVGCVATTTLGAIAAAAAGWLVFSDDSPIARPSAIRAAQERGRLADLPETAKDIEIKVLGSMFTREFIVTFRDSPATIRAWLAASPGPASAAPGTDASGWAVYPYPAGEGAIFAEVRVSPGEDEVRIITCRS